MNQIFELCGIHFDLDSVSWDDQNILRLDDLAISSFRTYFVIYNINNKKQMKSRSFANDWNAVVLQYLLKRILEDRKVLQ